MGGEPLKLDASADDAGVCSYYNELACYSETETRKWIAPSLSHELSQFQLFITHIHRSVQLNIGRLSVGVDIFMARYVYPKKVRILFQPFGN